jgi:hypothetical protein
MNKWTRLLLRLVQARRIERGPTIGRKRRARRARGRERQINHTTRSL